MQRDLLLLGEMLDAAAQAQDLTSGVTIDDLAADRRRRDALLWNFTVLGEAATQLSEDAKARFADSDWQRPARLRNRIVHGYWSIDLEILHTTAQHHLNSFVDEVTRVMATFEDEAPN